MGRFNDRWIPISSADFSDKKIMPGLKFHLTTDLERRLPSGHYKLTGILYVDGRRISPLAAEIDFDGDPTVQKLAIDSALILEPSELFIDSAPGGVRTSILSIENASDDIVEIETQSCIPKPLNGVAMGELRGDALSNAKWIRLSPAKFRIRGGGRQNVRVVTSMPKEEQHAHYYGDLILRATYPDGQSAGITKSLIMVRNVQAEGDPKATLQRVSLADGEGSDYILSARAVNTGNVHFSPACHALLVTGIGQTVAKAALSSGGGLCSPWKGGISPAFSISKTSAPGPMRCRRFCRMKGGKLSMKPRLKSVEKGRIKPFVF